MAAKTRLFEKLTLYYALRPISSLLVSSGASQPRVNRLFEESLLTFQKFLSQFSLAAGHALE
jgi:hypothetical protein